MGGHRIRFGHVRADEPVPPTDSLEPSCWTVRGSGLLCLDCASAQLSADGDQHCGNDPVRGGAAETFRLTLGLLVV